jgi:hypothetical protein
MQRWELWVKDVLRERTSDLERHYQLAKQCRETPGAELYVIRTEEVRTLVEWSRVSTERVPPQESRP